MKKLFIVLAITALFAGMAAAKLTVATPAYELEGSNRTNTEFWFDDMEGDVSGYSTTDFSAGTVPHFHWDTYMAYLGSGMSWWCGNFDYDTDGGYGNAWDDKLVIPELDLTSAIIPVLTYAFRHDSEAGFDYTYIQAESLGVYVNLNKGYDGVAPWNDIGSYGFLLATYDRDPFRARFRFMSDGGWSDQDGDYMSVGGGFACDNVKVFDAYTGAVLFFDTEPGADDCYPQLPPAAAGDFWHLIDRMCPAYSDPHSWWCGIDADTSLVPPNLQDGLFSPTVDISAAAACTAYMAVHFAVPTVDDDYCAFYGSAGFGYYGIKAYWGDFGTCDGWGGFGYIHGFDITQFDAPPFGMGGFLWIMYTTENGCGPGAGGDAGVMIDDVCFEGPLAGTPVEPVSWGSIKSLYR